MPLAFTLLEDACDVLINPPLAVEASFVVEVFAGEASLTLAMTLRGVPCLQPWDTIMGDRFCVLSHGAVLTSLAKAGRLAYVALASPCQSQSWGRLPALRTWDHPLGIPGLGVKQQQLVEKGNCLA